MAQGQSNRRGGSGGGRNANRRRNNGGGKRPAVSVKGRSDTHWIYGWHACIAALNNPRRQLQRVWFSESTLKKLEEHFEGAQSLWKQGLEVATPEMFQRTLPRDAVHQGCAVEVKPLPEQGLETVLQSERTGPVILLDQVTDPHNIGAVARSALAFDSKGIILCDRHSPSETGVMAKSAAGALEHMPLVHVPNLVNAMLALKNNDYWLIGLDGHTDMLLKDIPVSENVAMVLGAEGKGMRPRTKEHCDILARIPMTEDMESLNVSNAAAIMLYALQAS